MKRASRRRSEKPEGLGAIAMDSLRWTACHGQLTTVAILNPASTPLGVAFLRANLQSRGNLCGVALTRAMGTFDRPVEALKTSQNTTS